MQFRFPGFIALLVAVSGFITTGASMDSPLLLVRDTVINPPADTMPYVTLCFYHQYRSKLTANLRPVPIYVNDTLITELKVNRGGVFLYYREGRIVVSVDNKGETALPVKVKFGKSYFFRCDNVGGLANRRNTIETVPEKEGREESGMVQKN